MHLFQSALIYVGVDLSRRDIGMSQEFLDLAEVGAAGQQVRGETVPQRMRAHFAIHSGAGCILFDQRPDRFTAQASSRT